MDLSFLAAEDAALVPIIGGATFVLVNLIRRAAPSLDGRAVLGVVFGLALALTVLYLLYSGVVWTGQTIGRVGLVALFGGAFSVLGAETYKAQLVNRAQAKLQGAPDA